VSVIYLTKTPNYQNKNENVPMANYNLLDLPLSRRSFSLCFNRNLDASVPKVWNLEEADISLDFFKFSMNSSEQFSNVCKMSKYSSAKINVEHVDLNITLTNVLILNLIVIKG